jgi:hypothetical protein
VVLPKTKQFLQSKIRLANEDEHNTDLYLGDFLLGGAGKQAASGCLHSAIEELAPLFEEYAENALRAATSILMVEPDANGNYEHVVWCNGSRKVPPGQPGHICNCPLGSRIRAVEKAARIATLITSIRLVCVWCSTGVECVDGIHKIAVVNGYPEEANLTMDVECLAAPLYEVLLPLKGDKDVEGH